MSVQAGRLFRHDMMVGVVGPYAANKGDALMIEAIRQRLGPQCYLQICGEWHPRPPAGGRYGALLPGPVRRALGWHAPLRPAAMLDCSGFQYSDQWADLVPLISSRADVYAESRAQGAKIVLLPQALGPFRVPVVRELFARIVASADLVFARDARSVQHVLEAGCPAAKVAQAPDFSVLVEGEKPTDAGAWPSRVCIVPNERMRDRTPPAIAEAYRGFLLACIAQVRARGFEPVIVVHEEHDRAFAEDLRAAAGGGVLVLDEPPMRSKGMLGACHAVIGSRFHSLIGSLSQGVPTLGTVWTHKYQALFEEYDAADCLLPSLDQPDAVAAKLAHFFDEDHRRALIPRLQSAAARHKERVREMWTRVERLIFS